MASLSQTTVTKKLRHQLPRRGAWIPARIFSRNRILSHPTSGGSQPNQDLPEKKRRGSSKTCLYSQRRKVMRKN